MSQLKLYGMKAAYDEIITTAVKRQHEPQQIVGDLLNAEISEKQARSIKYQMTIAKLPLAKEVDEFSFEETPVNETLVRDLAAGEFLEQQRNVVLIGGTGTGKSHLAVSIARACIRRGKRGRFFNVVDLVNKLDAEARADRQGRTADLLCRLDFLILDELGYLPFAQTGGQLLFHLISRLYTFFLQNRLPVGLMRAGSRYWISAMGTNLAIGAGLAAIAWLGSFDVLLFVFLPTMLLAAITGMWCFYVQHQFEDTTWDHEEEWTVQEAALNGSSHYDLPVILRWISGNIGVHHVHHLASRIPFYRLREVIRDHEVLAQAKRLTLKDSFRCARLHLWDEKSRRLLSFADARAIAT